MNKTAHSAAFNAVQIAGSLENPCKTEVAELIAGCAVAMAEEEATNGRVWDWRYDEAIEEIAQMIAEGLANGMLVIARVPGIVRERMAARAEGGAA